MYDLLELYAQPYREREPVICIDEKSKQLVRDSRPALAMRTGTAMKRDFEYVRAGTCNVFVAVEPKGGRRVVRVTERRTKADFVEFVQSLLNDSYAYARKVHLVLIISTRTSVRASKRFSVRPRLASCCAGWCFTIRPSMRAG